MGNNDGPFTKVATAGLHNLRRYFELIIFQSYLQSIQPDTMRSFETIETFVKDRPGQYIFQIASTHPSKPQLGGYL